MQDGTYLLSLGELLENEDLEAWKLLVKRCLKWVDETHLKKLECLAGAENAMSLEQCPERLYQKRRGAEVLGAGMLLQLAIRQAEMPRQYGSKIVQLTVSELLTALETVADSPLSPEYTYGERGKPYFKNYPYYFNLSHSGEYLFMVLSDREMGVDIQQEKVFRAEKIARRFFAEEEIETLAGYTSHRERQRLFFDLWACKEAYGKLTGEGIAGALDQNIGLSEKVELQQYRIRDYYLAVCKWKQEF